MLMTGDEYTEASRASGAGPLRTAVRVDVPMAKQGIGVALVLVLTLLLHEFSTAALVVTADTNVLATLLYDRWVSGTTAEVSVIALLIVIVTLVALVVAALVAGARSLKKLM